MCVCLYDLSLGIETYFERALIWAGAGECIDGELADPIIGAPGDPPCCCCCCCCGDAPP